MTDDQLKFADECIDKLYKSYPSPSYLNQKHDVLSQNDRMIVFGILESDNWIVYCNLNDYYKLEKAALPVLDKHKTYTKYLEFDLKKERRNEQKEIFDFKVSKWKYHTFWYFFAIAIFGGGYSVYDFIERLTKAESVQQGQNPKAEKELEVSKLHTLVLDQKNLDSLHISKD